MVEIRVRVFKSSRVTAETFQRSLPSLLKLPVSLEIFQSFVSCNCYCQTENYSNLHQFLKLKRQEIFITSLVFRSCSQCPEELRPLPKVPGC